MKLNIVFIGIEKHEVFTILARHKIPYRIYKEDNANYMLSHEFKEDRINLTIKDGIVIDYKFY